MIRLTLIMLAFATAVLAVQPDEILDDPELEARARDISQELRCLVCQNENIDDSNAELARDLRLLVRERLTEGDSDEQVVAYVVDRYGEYVLLRPTLSAKNLFLWLTGPILLILGGILAFAFLRRRSTATPVSDTLSDDEEKRLQDLLND